MCVLEVWFDGEVVAIEVYTGVKLESWGGTIGKLDTVEVAFTVLTNSVCVTVAMDNVGEEGSIVWETDDVALTLATV